ncbi:hypothetical protein BD324DRAFT_640137 [Kockovaella imperatae]|uniref:Uncharacterized protein n=1 Tax=Kockovaella imperatae TaxID=4999 RepID=A0A1Y1U5M1_9TREE|nr:hypothetical protein BD324DRAFT_640137 [Kockovaella imperatae]ORX33330.1 hypothetical protein BD324DRAFT_640137 [Kockovaella imperatae]
MVATEAFLNEVDTFKEVLSITSRRQFSPSGTYEITEPESSPNNVLFWMRTIAAFQPDLRTNLDLARLPAQFQPKVLGIDLSKPGLTLSVPECFWTLPDPLPSSSTSTSFSRIDYIDISSATFSSIAQTIASMLGANGDADQTLHSVLSNTAALGRTDKGSPPQTLQLPQPQPSTPSSSASHPIRSTTPTDEPHEWGSAQAADTLRGTALDLEHGRRQSTPAAQLGPQSWEQPADDMGAGIEMDLGDGCSQGLTLEFNPGAEFELPAGEAAGTTPLTPQHRSSRSSSPSTPTKRLKGQLKRRRRSLTRLRSTSPRAMPGPSTVNQPRFASEAPPMIRSPPPLPNRRAFRHASVPQNAGPSRIPIPNFAPRAPASNPPQATTDVFTASDDNIVHKNDNRCVRCKTRELEDCVQPKPRRGGKVRRACIACSKAARGCSLSGEKHYFNKKATPDSDDEAALNGEVHDIDNNGSENNE